MRVVAFLLRGLSIKKKKKRFSGALCHYDFEYYLCKYTLTSIKINVIIKNILNY